MAVWVLGARFTPGTVVQRSKASRLIYFVLILGSALLLILQPRRIASFLSRSMVPGGRPLAWGGVILVAAGLAFATWARIALGRFWTSAPSIKAKHDLVRTGPYALTRHPIYTGLLLAVAATALSRATIAALGGLTLFALALTLKIREEERLLAAHFGEAYRSYRRNVPAILPTFGLR
jgi:protein-S-isoprenylcysteine O-methyltransferase Ste14